MSSNFLNEAECYSIIKRYGISTPKHILIESAEKIDALPFNDGQQVVYKAVIDELWHKSDSGLITFTAFSSQKTIQTFNHFKEQNSDKEKWIGLLVCEKIEYPNQSLPVELLLSIKQDVSCGPVVTVGFGGIHTELWGKELQDGVLNFPVDLITIDEAVAEFSGHLMGKIIFGKVRNGEAFTTPDKIRYLFTGVWQLAADLGMEDLSLIEINPLVINKDGQFTALDGVGQKSAKSRQDSINNAVNISSEKGQALLIPQTIAIIGVSSRKKGFGNIILDNLKESDIAQENITVIKPDSDGFEGFRTLNSIHDLATAVDAIILAVPADQAVTLIEQIFICKAAKIIHLVAGGIGDGADHSGLKARLRDIIKKYDGPDRPLIIGPNSLGMVLSPQKINTLFIPKNKLAVHFHAQGNMALVSQSGAFFITRLSGNSSLNIRYGLCIGNQIDLTATEILMVLARDNDIDVIGLYLEGPPAGNALALAKAIKNISSRKKIIIYRAGRSNQGMQAAAGHTGALASDYHIEKKLLLNAGAIICESFSHYENYLKWYSAYPRFELVNHGISVISNAGYESVAGADGLGSYLSRMSSDTKMKLTEVLQQYKLSGIVSPANPLDITPMASDAVYYECSKVLLQADETRVLIVGIVPLTVMVETDDSDKLDQQAALYRDLQQQYGKPIAIVIDAGDAYKKIKAAFTQNNLPVFSSVQDVVGLLLPG